MSTFNSINTNRAAVFAIQSLNQNTLELNVTQKRISTGFRVADSRDDTGAFSVAQAVRSDMAGLTAVNEQMGGARGIVSTTATALNSISNTMQQLRTTATRLADSAITADSRVQYENQFNLLNQQIRSFITDSTYNGRTLLSTSGGAGGGNLVGIRNEAGREFTINAIDGNTLTYGGDLTSTLAPPSTAAQAQAFIQQAASDTGTGYMSIERRINNAMASIGAAGQFVDAQIIFNTKRLDALNDGLGALVDADLVKESSRVQALQTRQQLSFQTLSLANQAPQSLLSLFR